MNDAAIAVERLSKRYGQRTVVDGISLDVRAGEIVALLGPNGAGKTTIVEIVEGYRRADDGEVRVLGVDPSTFARMHRARVGLMLQAGGFDMRARPAETLRQYAAFHADPLESDGLLDELGLRRVAATPFRQLSGGERQRLAFAVALAGRPEVLILDEPTAGMDPQGRAIVRERIAAERAAGTAVLLTTHELADAERLADRILILVDGHIAGSGTAAELAAGVRPRLRFAVDRALDETELAALGLKLGVSVRATGDAGRYEIDAAPPTPALVSAVAVWCESAGRLITEARTIGGTLEDAYLELVAAAVPETPP